MSFRIHQIVFVGTTRVFIAESILKFRCLSDMLTKYMLLVKSGLRVFYVWTIFVITEYQWNLLMGALVLLGTVHQVLKFAIVPWSFPPTFSWFSATLSFFRCVVPLPRTIRHYLSEWELSFIVNVCYFELL